MHKRGSYWFVAALVLISLLLLSCQPSEKTTETGTSTGNTTTEISVDGCAPQWECVDENYKAYVLADCTRTQVSKCERGCFNGTCIAAPTCTVGFKCIDEKRKAYQKEDCSFINKKSCDWGCDKDKCQEKPANASNETAASATAPAAPTTSYAAENEEGQVEKEDKTRYSLKFGEQQELEISGTKHNVSIYNLETDRVILKVNGIKSEWIGQGGNFTYGNIGATFYIESILFQTYGTKAIDFTIS